MQRNEMTSILCSLNDLSFSNRYWKCIATIFQTRVESKTKTKRHKGCVSTAKEHAEPTPKVKVLRIEDNAEYFKWFQTKRTFLNKKGIAEIAQQKQFYEVFNIYKAVETTLN